MKLLLITLSYTLAAFAPCVAMAAGNRPAFALDLETAKHAVVEAHPELAGDAMELATPISLRDPSPVLQAGPLERFGTSGRVRLRCQGENTCLPFYILVHLPAPETAAIGGGALAVSKTAENVLRFGDHASMLIDSGLLHLRLPVTCLQAGAVGQTIRVAGPSHSKVYQVAVVDRSTVRGSL